MNTLVRTLDGVPETLDPQLMEMGYEGWVGYDLFEGLVTYSNEGKLIPAQATSWEVSEDGRRWRFHLQPGLKWSDGRPLTAKDFEYSFRRLADPKTAAAYAWFLETLDVTNASAVIRGEKPVEALGVRAVDDSQLEISLEHPVAYFLELLAFYGFLPVPEHVISEKGSRWILPENMVGNGAFRLEQWRVNESIVLKRNPHYRDYETVRLDSVAYALGGDPLARFRSGEVHLSGNITREQQDWVLKNQPESLHASPGMGVYLLFININRICRTQDRQALALAVDRAAIAQSRILGLSEPAWQVAPPHYEGFSPQLPDLYRLSVQERVKRVKPECRLSSLRILYSNSAQNDKRLALMTQENWQRHLGIRVQLEGYERKVFYERLNAGDYDVVVMSWGGPYNDPASLLNIWHSSSVNNRSFYRSAVFDDLLERSRGEFNTVQRMSLLAQAEENLIQDVPVIPVVHPKNVRLVSGKVDGYQRGNPMGRTYSRYLGLHKSGNQ
ncbi:peptide ABC transporter substrate-binding protein [Spongorhabdus nitratireducens]